MFFENTLEFAKKLDAQDPLKDFRAKFNLPTFHEKTVRYFTGNSLGLQPKKAVEYVNEELQNWAKFGVEGHFLAERPWFSYHENLTQLTANVVGALPIEVVVTHSLTTNLHLLMVSFYQPKGKRTKILCEAKAFPSDQYALESQVNFHGLSNDHLVEIAPREGENLIRLEDILAKIEELGDELALVFIGGVNYYTGQVFDMNTITAAGHKAGAIVGWDLAHAAGNISLNLHEWQVDFAAWCSYKYMNSGPGNASGYFVHEKHHSNKELDRFAGWYGHNKSRRFLMEPNFDAVEGANGWQVSNLPVLSLAPYLATVEMFVEVGMEKLIAKRNQITSYLEFILHEIDKEIPQANFEVITPSNQSERGCQLSVYLHGQGKELFTYLMQNGVVTDWREPNVIRLAPVPFYTSFEDIYNFGQILKKGILK
jgi:kynureninase